MRLFDAIAAQMPLYLPRQSKQGVSFAPWTTDDTASTVDITNVHPSVCKTTISPKGFFLPMLEGLYTSHLAQTEHGKTWQITPAPLPSQPFVLLGVRTCDMAGLALLGKVFLAEPVDVSYKTRRTAAHIITLPCDKRCVSCFCDAFGIDRTQPGGDVTLHLDANTPTWQVHTPKGEALTATWTQDLFPPIIPNTVNTNPTSESSADLPASVLAKFEAHFFDGAKTDTNALDLFNAPAWDTLHHTCIACGTCAFLCPTCQCYDIHTQTEHCHRHWDTCLNASFTQMAHGNPRPSKKERFRQRFMHKLVYFKQRYGVFGCVGCGRCVEFCPAGINPVDVACVLYETSL